MTARFHEAVTSEIRTLSGRTLAPRSLKASLNLRLLPSMATLTVIRVSELTGTLGVAMDAIVAASDGDDSALGKAFGFGAHDAPRDMESDNSKLR